MARFFEYQGKRLLKDAGITIPTGEVAATAEEAYEIATRIGKPVVIKAQVWVGGRGKAGAIKFADTPEEAKNVAGLILGSQVKGFLVREVLVEEKLNIDKEYYLSVIPDSSWTSRAPVSVRLSWSARTCWQPVGSASPMRLTARGLPSFLDSVWLSRVFPY